MELEVAFKRGGRAFGRKLAQVVEKSKGKHFLGQMRAGIEEVPGPTAPPRPPQNPDPNRGAPDPIAPRKLKGRGIQEVPGPSAPHRPPQHPDPNRDAPDPIAPRKLKGRGGANDWVNFVKAYAKEHGMKYGDALKAAGPAYRAFK